MGALCLWVLRGGDDEQRGSSGHDEEVFQLVGPGDDNPDENKILTSSPIGQGLIGKKRGDVAEIKVPMGKLRFEVLDISLPE